MRNLNTIVKQKPVYLHNWTNKFSVMSDFNSLYMSEDEYKADKSPYANEEFWLEKKVRAKRLLDNWKDIKILFASYGTDNYSGSAFVLFTRDGKLYEVNGDHCSCYGLEDQWSPEETTLKALKDRLIKGTMGKDRYSDNEFAAELINFLGIKSKELV